MYQKIFAMMLMAFLGFSCQNSVNNNQEKDTAAGEQTTVSSTTLPDISGHFSLPETGCDIALIIIKENNIFRYFFKGTHLDLQGIAIVSVENNECYITFDGPIGNTPNKTVSALYNDNTIVIQNYGNASNNYHYFSDCSEKYLEFKKD